MRFHHSFISSKCITSIFFILARRIGIMWAIRIIEIRSSKHNAGAPPAPKVVVVSGFIRKKYIDGSSALFQEREIKSKRVASISGIWWRRLTSRYKIGKGSRIMPRSRYKKSDEIFITLFFIEMYYVYILYSVSVDN